MLQQSPTLLSPPGHPAPIPGFVSRITPSRSRPKVEHLPVIDPQTGECSCNCEHFTFRLASKSPTIATPRYLCHHLASLIEAHPELTQIKAKAPEPPFAHIPLDEFQPRLFICDHERTVVLMPSATATPYRVQIKDQVWNCTCESFKGTCTHCVDAHRWLDSRDGLEAQEIALEAAIDAIKETAWDDDEDLKSLHVELAYVCYQQQQLDQIQAIELAKSEAEWAELGDPFASEPGSHDWYAQEFAKIDVGRVH